MKLNGLEFYSLSLLFIFLGLILYWGLKNPTKTYSNSEFSSNYCECLTKKRWQSEYRLKTCLKYRPECIN